MTPITNVVTPSLSSVTPTLPITPLSETPKVNNAITNLVSLGPAPAPEENKKLFPFLPFGGKRKMRKTKKSKRKAKKNTHRRLRR